MQTLYFVRHGETDWNLERRTQGDAIDTDLNDTGKYQARQTGVYLRKYGPFDQVISSPMRRAKDTAELICREIHYDPKDIRYDTNLREKSYGDLNGRTPNDIKIDPIFREYNRILRQWSTIPDPIERMETLDAMDEQLYTLYKIEPTADVKYRCQLVLDQIKLSNATNILIVTHGYIIKALLKLILCLRWEIPMGKLVAEGNCMIMRIDWSDDYGYEIVTVPTNEHLEYITVEDT